MQARLELNTRTSQPVYIRVYRIGTVWPTVFCVRQALMTLILSCLNLKKKSDFQPDELWKGQ